MTELASRQDRAPVRPAVAVLLIVLGLGLLVLWRIASGTEQHSWDRSAVPPAYAELVSGHSYAISLPGGVPAAHRQNVSPDSLSCSISGTGVGTQDLTLTTEQDGTKATQQIASFVSPVTGAVQVSCAHLPPVFVDDAENARFDWAGVLVWAGAAALAVGLPLGLSSLRDSVRAGGSGRARDDDQVE